MLISIIVIHAGNRWNLTVGQWGQRDETIRRTQHFRQTLHQVISGRMYLHHRTRVVGVCCNIPFYGSVNMLTQKKLKELLHYNPKTGVFKWKASRSGIRADMIAGSNTFNKYSHLMVDTVLYLSSRLAWFYVNGYFPEEYIDHINRIKSDNRIENLREVTNQCNQRNCGNHKHNTSGVKGVCWVKKNNKWQASIKLNRNGKYLGQYMSFDNAVCARLAAEQCLDWVGCDSNSPAYQYVKTNIQGV